MFLRMPKFIRRWLRKTMGPMQEQQAWTAKEKLSILYMILAWNAGGMVIWQLSKGNVHWPVTEGLVTEEEENISRPSLAYAKALDIPQAKSYRFSFREGLRELPEIDLLRDEAVRKAKEEAAQKNATETESQ